MMMIKTLKRFCLPLFFLAIMAVFTFTAPALAQGAEKQSGMPLPVHSFSNKITGRHVPPISQVFNKRFSHYSEAEPLVTLLETFARSQGLRAAFTPNVKGEVSGRFDKLLPEIFLAGIYSAFGIEWYVLDDILHFYVKQDLERRLIYLTAVAPSKMKEILMSAGLLSPQLPSSTNDADNVFVFSGPTTYANGIAQAVKSYEDTFKNEQEIRVFFLKHAWADDVQIGSGDGAKMIPGVATILRQMILQTGSTSRQLALGTQKNTTIRSTVPMAATAQGGGQATLEELKQEAKEQMELDRKIASPMNAVTGGLPGGGGVFINPPQILADARSNSIIIRDARYRMPKYESAIKQLDKPQDIVEIHAAIVDVDTNYSRNLGVELGGIAEVGGSLVGIGSNVNSTPESPSITGAGFNFSTVYTQGASYFIAQVNALENQGDARILGRPSVLTIDNASASLVTSTSFYIRVVGENVVSLEEVSSGTTLQVTPHVIKYDDRDSMIKLSVMVQDGQEPEVGSTINDIPAVVKKTVIETQGFVAQGQSLLIGGYYYESIKSGDSGVTGLKNLPVIGALFKSDSKNIQRMERMILITPRIIDPLNMPDKPLGKAEIGFTRSPYSTEHGTAVPAYPVPPKSIGCASSDKSLSTNPSGSGQPKE